MTTACERTALVVVEPPTYPFDLIRQYEGTSLCVSASFMDKMGSENLVRARLCTVNSQSGRISC